MILGWNDKSPRLARTLGAGLLAITALLVARPASALDEDPKPEEKSDGSLYLVPLLAPKAPAIDGRLNEEGWGNAGIVRMHKVGAAKENPSRATEVYLTIDAENLYVAFRCGEPFPERRKRSAKGRDLDGIGDDDTVSVQLQPSDDAKSPYYEVTVTSTGAVALTQHGAGKAKSWNAGGIQAAVRDALGGWVVEVRVPFKALGRGTPEAGERWRANFVRHVATVEPAEYATWAPQASLDARPAEHFAELRFE